MKKVLILAALIAFTVGIVLLGQRPAVKPNVLVILIDTLRADHLGMNGYERNTSPFLDSFAKENLNFTKAMSSASWTPPSVATLVSGMYASIHGHMPLRSQTDYGKRFTKLDDSFITMAEVFKGAEYSTAAISANPIISKKYGFAQGFDLFVSPGRENAEKVNARTKKYLSTMRPKDKPFFLYLQYMDPHDPYDPPAPYDKSFQGTLKSREYPKQQADFINQYDGEISYVDTKISELFTWLKTQGLYEDLIIMIVSDHGEQFLERGYQGHADRTYLEEAHVPFILKTKGKKGDIDTIVSTVDMFPTVLDAAGVEFKHPVHGYSLLSDLEKRSKEGVMSEIIRHVNEKSFTAPNGMKLINEYPMQRGMFVAPELLTKDAEMKSSKIFDINKDQFELSPMSDSNARQTLEEEFSALYQKVLKLKGLYTTGDVELDEKGIEELKTLGYF